MADIILMDIHMSEIDGMEATKRIKSDRKLVHIPIIGLTAEAFQDRHQEFKSLSMVDVITKPYKEDQLLQLLSTYSARKLDRASSS